MAGFLTAGPPKDGMVRMKSYAPAALLREYPIPWAPPNWRAPDKATLAFWWSQIHYVFDLPDPRLFPPFGAPLSSDAAEVIRRFADTTADLASSQVMNTRDTRISISFDDKTNEPSIAEATLPARDATIGFSVLLRQCLSPKDPANYGTVADFIKAAAYAQSDASHTARLESLSAWRGAIESVRKASLEQLVRDRMVAEESWKVFDYREPMTPNKLLQTLNYGDLIHWGSTRGQVVARSADEVESLRQTMDYLDAAVGLGYVLCGFGLLAEAAITPRTEILIP
jgi:hypothetical protein